MGRTRGRLWVGLMTAVAVGLGDGGCKVKLKTIDLQTSDLQTGLSGQSGSQGFCLSQGSQPPSPFSAGAGQVMIGFDHFFKPGTDPFPCNQIRASTFRGGIKFDVSKFGSDSVVTAQLKFDAQRSISRAAGETTSQSPPKSVAKMLGLAKGPFDGAMADDDMTAMPAGESFVIGVEPAVRDWIDKKRKNFGFVLWGPKPPTTENNLPEDNKAELTWYGNFRLTVLYNPATSPQAPQ